MKTMEEKIMEKLDHALSAVRQSTPDALSPILHEIRNKIDKQSQAMRDHVELHAINDKRVNEALARIEPYIATFEKEKTAYEYAVTKGKAAIFWSAVLASVGSLWIAFRHFK